MKKKYIVIGIILSVIIMMTIIIIVLTKSSNPSKNIISSTLDKEMEVLPNIYYEDNTVLIEDNNQLYYLSVKNEKLIYEKFINKDDTSKYTLVENEGILNLINKKTNNKSVDFIEYEIITINNEIKYYILKTLDNFLILDTTQDKYIELDKEIINFSEIYNIEDKLVSDKYLVVFNSNNKYGVIDYTGKFIIDFKYESIKISDVGFIVKKDGKYGVINTNDKMIVENKFDMLFEYQDMFLSIYNGKYGIINSKGEELLEHKYTFAQTKKDHVALATDGKIAIFTDKLVLEPIIDLSEKNKLTSYIFNDNIHIITNNQTYIVNNGKIIKTIDKKLFKVLLEETENDYSQKYLYARETNELTSKFEIYNKDYNIHYSFEIKENENPDDYVMTSNVSTIDEKIYNVNVTLMPENDKETIEKTIQYSFDEKREINQNDLVKIKLENDISYLIDKNNNLTIYNKEKIIGEYKDILYHIGQYYFIDKNGVVYKLNFKYK